MAIATFGAGCFWGVEAAFRQVEGVTATSVGYAGGTLAQPTYEQVCAGNTGHAKVVRVEFDPARVDYQTLLKVCWTCHDPTQVNRQGADVGEQYRSVIFAHGPDLHPLQTAFMEGFAAQCGYCTPGMLMAAKALLDRNPSPTREEVIEAISGNLCRCTGYEPIVEAILTAARAPRHATGRTA